MNDFMGWMTIEYTHQMRKWGGVHHDMARMDEDWSTILAGLWIEFTHQEQSEMRHRTLVKMATVMMAIALASYYREHGPTTMAEIPSLMAQYYQDPGPTPVQTLYGQNPSDPGTANDRSEP